ncbi:DUF1642 domain-containing protein [Enterococcus innesii]|uniref:DUF1642 domain-containing protein n=1 Tax=Enterococcus innesii TaxID=2839759 RepID=UPI003D0AA468
MNKQELLKELESNKDKCFKEAIKYEALSWDRQIVDSKALVYMQVINWVEQLAEQPKVTVPQFLDKYIQENKGECASDVFSEEWLHDSADELDDEVDKWLYDNDGTENDRRYLIAVQAFVTGEYEVEKEPKFIVKVGNLYLIEPLGDTSDSTIRTTWNHKNAYEFTSYDMAQTHANKFGGEVEEVK